MFWKGLTSQMKNMSMLVWFTQLGLSVALPPVGFILFAVWLKDAFGWGSWVIYVGIALGLIGAFDGFRTSLKAMKKMSDKDQEQSTVSFNDHN
jgi:hypothetical protein